MHKSFMYCNTCIDKKWNLPQSMFTYTRNDIILIIFLLSCNSDPLQRVTGGHLEPVWAGNEWEVGYSGHVFTLLKELAYTDRQQNITQGHRKPAINLTRTSLDCVKPGVLKDFHANPTHRPWPMWELNHHSSLVHHSVHCATFSWFVQQTPEQNDCKFELSS